MLICDGTANASVWCCVRAVCCAINMCESFSTVQDTLSGVYEYDMASAYDFYMAAFNEITECQW